MTIEINKGSTVITGEGSIAFYRMLSLLHVLKLEMKGIKYKRGFSAYAKIKKDYGLKGNRQKVFDQFQILVDEESAKQERIVNQDGWPCNKESDDSEDDADYLRDKE